MRVAVLTLLLVAQVAHGFVYSCNEVKNKINAGPQVSTDFACIVLEDGYASRAALQNISVQTDRISISLDALAESPGGCIASGASGGAWRFVSEQTAPLSCNFEFSIILTSAPHRIIEFTNKTQRETGATNLVFASAGGGMAVGMEKCLGKGNITWLTGAGLDTTENRFPLQSFKCANLPRWITSFENVVTILVDAGVSYEFTYTNNISTGLELQRGERGALLTSGLSDNLQNLNRHRNSILFKMSESMPVTAGGSVSLDPADYSDIICNLQHHGYKELVPAGNGPVDWSVQDVESVLIEYSSFVQVEDLGERPETFVIELLTGDIGPAKYCGCDLGGKFNLPVDWNPNEIWLDIAVILDTSEAMGEDSLEAAAVMIESFVGNGAIVTDLAATYSTRLGVISMASDAQILYDLNMTSTDRIEGKVHITKGLDNIDVMKAFGAALDMFQRGVASRPERANYRQVIYYVIDSDSKVDENPLNQFKSSQGIIIVNNFLDDGDEERPGLKQLASDGYYLTDIGQDYMLSIQAFCKANCHCAADRVPYGGQSPDPAIKAAGGCYHPMSGGVGYSKAKQACQDLRGGRLPSVHDNDKGAYLNDLVLGAYKKKYFFWIGYSRDNEAMNWEWEDKSTDGFTNWDTNEPNPNVIAKCAYIDMSEQNLPWGAGNCNLGLPYVCEYEPCSAGNKNC